jgi:hypothetical protein
LLRASCAAGSSGGVRRRGIFGLRRLDAVFCGVLRRSLRRRMCAAVTPQRASRKWRARRARQVRPSLEIAVQLCCQQAKFALIPSSSRARHLHEVLRTAPTFNMADDEPCAPLRGACACAALFAYSPAKP